jgi:hypothetical protein
MIKRFFFVIVFIFFLPTLTFASFAWSGRMESYQQNRLLEPSPPSILAKYVKEQLGHSSIETTVDIYGHLIPSSNRDAVNRLDAQLSATYTQPAKKEEPHLIEDTALLQYMVPKAGNYCSSPYYYNLLKLFIPYMVPNDRL